jgi:hypothetical protein
MQLQMILLKLFEGATYTEGRIAVNVAQVVRPSCLPPSIN